MKRYDLMHEINGRGTFMVSQTCLPYLLQSKNKHGRVPHILNNAPVSLLSIYYLIYFFMLLINWACEIAKILFDSPQLFRTPWLPRKYYEILQN